MKKYFHLFFVALFATVPFVFVGCEEEEEPEKQEIIEEAYKLTYDGTELYYCDSLRNITSASLNYQKANQMMQLQVDLFPQKGGWEVKGQAKVWCNVEVKPFNVSAAQKGDPLEIITSRYTWIMEGNPMFINATSTKKFFKVTEGGITYNGRTEKGLVSLKVDMTIADEEGTTRKMAGTLNCLYDANATQGDMGGYFEDDYPYDK